MLSVTSWLCAQCEALMASLANPAAAQQPREVAINMAGSQGSAEARLGSAAAAENDRYIASEGNRQQLLLRCSRASAHSGSHSSRLISSTCSK